MLKKGSAGKAVRQLQAALHDAGFRPGVIDGIFGPATEAAVLALQQSERLVADGVVGPATWKALALPPASGPSPSPALERITIEIVSELFPEAPLGNIKAHLSGVLDELRIAGLASRSMVLMALATIRAETAGFEPISEAPSRFNTSPDGEPFDLYDHRQDLGNRGPGDGVKFRGRGFVQLTGRANYKRIGNALDMGDQLLKHPELANDSAIAARILATFLQENALPIKIALLDGNLKAARRQVNGGIHGFGHFATCYRLGEALLPEVDKLELAAVQAGEMRDES